MGNVFRYDLQVDRLASLDRDFRRRECKSFGVNLDRSCRLLSGSTGCQQCEHTDRVGPLHVPSTFGLDSRIETAIIYGARKARSFFSSSRDSRARVRICIAMVPDTRGEMLIGGMWHREQFALNTSSPVDCVAAFVP